MRKIQIWPLKPSSVTFSHNNTSLKWAHYGNITIFINYVTRSFNSCLKQIEDIRINKRAEECAKSKSGL